MRLRLFIRPEAEVDISNAYRWYEKQMKGLGRRFVESIDKALRSIQTCSTSFRPVYKNLRRALLRSFPYAVFFLREKDSIIVIAVLHQARDPRRWKIRYKPSLRPR